MLRFITYLFWGQIIWFVFGTVLVIVTMHPSVNTIHISLLEYFKIIASFTLLWGIMLGALVYFGMIIGGLVESMFLIIFLPIIFGALFGVMIGYHVVPYIASNFGLDIISLPSRIIMCTLLGIFATPVIIRFSSKK